MNTFKELEELTETQINAACRSTIYNLKGWFMPERTEIISDTDFEEFLLHNIEFEKNHE